jgi:hypothetical protein
VAWIDVGLKNNFNQTIFAKEITNNLKLVQEKA